MPDDNVEITQLPPPPPPKVPPHPTTNLLPQVDPEKERIQLLNAFGLHVSPERYLPPVPTRDPAPPAPPAAGTPPPPAPPAPAPGTPAPPAPPAPAPAPAAPTPAAGTPPPPAPPAPATPPPPAAPAPTGIDTPEAIARRAAGSQPLPPPPSAPVPAPGTPEDAELSLRLDALRELSKSGKYGNRDLAKEYTEYLDKKLAAYQKAWEGSHPGEDFDLESAEHNEWRDRNEPDIDEDDIARAEGRVDTLRMIEHRDREREVREFSSGLADASFRSAAASVSEVLSFADGKEYKSLADLDAVDPLAAVIARPLLTQAAELSAAITTLLTPGSPAKFNPENPVHVDVARHVRHYETEIMRLPEEQRLDSQGRKYVSADDYVKMSPIDRQRVWTFRFAPDEMRAIAVNHIRVGAKAEYDALKTRVGVPAPSATPTPPPPAPPRPPTVGAGPGSVPNPAAPSSKGPRGFWE